MLSACTLNKRLGREKKIERNLGMRMMEKKKKIEKAYYKRKERKGKFSKKKREARKKKRKKDRISSGVRVGGTGKADPGTI